MATIQSNRIGTEQPTHSVAKFGSGVSTTKRKWLDMRNGSVSGKELRFHGGLVEWRPEAHFFCAGTGEHPKGLNLRAGVSVSILGNNPVGSSMSHHSFNPEHLALTRREFLGRCG